MTAAAPLAPTMPPRNAVTGGFLRWLKSRPGAAAIAGLLAFAGPLIFFSGALSVLRVASVDSIARLGGWWAAYGITQWALLLVAGYFGERLTTGRRAPDAALWLLGATLVALTVNLGTVGRASLLIEQGLVQDVTSMQLHGFIFSLTTALLFFAHLARSRDHQQACARLAAAQAAQRHARRRIVEARLHEVQARIDPSLLFEMLDAVRRIYEHDAARAERLLDELIVFLRAALPRLRSPSSTLLREIDLARSYVRLRALAEGADADMAIEVSTEALHARFPPGVLLPLLTPGEPMRPCALTASRCGDSCRIQLAISSAPPDAAIARVRALLIELEPVAGQLSVERSTEAEGVRVIVTVPYEIA